MSSKRDLIVDASTAEMGAVTQGTSHALVIGINAYQDNNIHRLRFARADAEAFHRLLIDPQLGGVPPENVRLLVDDTATRSGIVREIAVELPRRVQTEDRVIIFFAGHGGVWQDRRFVDGFEKYLVPSDADITALPATALSIEELERHISRFESKQLVLFLDACYSGGAAEGRSFVDPDRLGRAGGIQNEYLDRLAGAGRVIITACDAREVALEDAEVGHGVFTHYLLKGLAGKADPTDSGRVALDPLYEWVFNQVKSHARQMGGSMEPCRKGEVKGSIILTHYETKVQREAKSWAVEAQEAREAGNLSRSRDLWKAVLELIPDHDEAKHSLKQVEAGLERERKTWRGLQRRLLALNRTGDETGTLPIKEYRRGTRLLASNKERLNELDQEVKRYLLALIENQITVVTYLVTVDLLDEEALAQANATRTEEDDSRQVEPRPSTREETGDVPPERDVPAASRDGGSGTESLAQERVPGERSQRDVGQSARTSSRGVDSFKDALTAPEMVVIPAGTFVMGSPETGPKRLWKEGPEHEVTVKAFALGRYPVTRAEYGAFVEEEAVEWPEPPFIQTELHPAVMVSWEEARAYAEWLTHKTGSEYRLCSEAEWEYAARAGSQAARFWGEEWIEGYAHVGREATAPVGILRPNAFGLHDMLGNVWEWVADCWNESYSGAPRDGSTWLGGNCSLRVLRGGSWLNLPSDVRSAARVWYVSGNRLDNYGFRVARSLR